MIINDNDNDYLLGVKGLIYQLILTDNLLSVNVPIQHALKTCSIMKKKFDVQLQAAVKVLKVHVSHSNDTGELKCTQPQNIFLLKYFFAPVRKTLCLFFIEFPSVLTFYRL